MTAEILKRLNNIGHLSGHNLKTLKSILEIIVVRRMIQTRQRAVFSEKKGTHIQIVELELVGVIWWRWYSLGARTVCPFLPLNPLNCTMQKWNFVSLINITFCRKVFPDKNVEAALHKTPVLTNLSFWWSVLCQLKKKMINFFADKRSLLWSIETWLFCLAEKKNNNNASETKCRLPSCFWKKKKAEFEELSFLAIET